MFGEHALLKGMTNLKIKNSNKLFRVENVYCVGRNYPEHIKEMNYQETPEEPVIFLKPNTAVVTSPGVIRIPDFKGKKISDNLQNELELVVAIGKKGRDIPEEKADEYIFGYCVGIDFTLRDLQTAAKQKGLPWATSKGFIGSAPVSEIVVGTEHCSVPTGLNLKLYINGEYKQGGNTSEMLFSVSYLIHYISSIFVLKKGDLIFTGTPAGVHKLNPGDVIEAEIESIGKLSVSMEE